jgi:hypothetical protein
LEFADLAFTPLPFETHRRRVRVEFTIDLILVRGFGTQVVTVIETTGGLGFYAYLKLAVAQRKH